MANLNKSFLLGNLTRDPELRYAPSGTSICEFGLAVNNGSKEKPEVMFIDVIVFGKIGEAIPRYASKGSSMLVEGRLKLDQWEDRQTGQKRSRHVIIAERVQFIGSMRQQEQQ